MAIDQAKVDVARQYMLYAAKNLLTEAISRSENFDLDAADVLVVTVLRVLDGYEAIAQLPDVHDLARTPDKPVPFRVSRPRDA